jgi:hypothetical protein
VATQLAGGDGFVLRRARLPLGVELDHRERSDFELSCIGFRERNKD